MHIIKLIIIPFITSFLLAPNVSAYVANVFSNKENISYKRAKEVATSAYIFAYPLVLMDLTQQEAMRKKPVNAFDHLRTFPNDHSRLGVNPHTDTLYSRAWLDVSKEPVILSVPATEHYYMMPMMDAWTNVFASPGPRTTGTKAQNFLIAPLSWEGDLPENMERIVTPTKMIWLMGRTYVKNMGDLKTIHEIQDEYKLTPLSVWLDQEKPKTIDPLSKHKKFSHVSPVKQIAQMSVGEFFNRVALLMKDNPPSGQEGSMVTSMAEIGFFPGEEYKFEAQPHTVKRALKAAKKEALKRIGENLIKGKSKKIKENNNWISFDPVGTYGTDYLARATVAMFSLGADVKEDAVYANAKLDADDQPFVGHHRYVLHFEKGQTPPVKGFWSLTLYNNEQFLVKNPLNRHSIGDRDDYQLNKDGSLDIYIQHKSPGKEKEANWLPAPKGGFNLTMRLYWPDEDVLKGKWKLPVVKMVDHAETQE